MATKETINTRSDHTAHDETIAPQLAELELTGKPDGPAAAAMVAAGIGIFALGFLTTMAEISEGFKEFLAGFDFVDGVGPLAGKTTLAVVVWAAAWGILAVIWHDKDTDLRRMFAIGLVLGLLGALGTFPTFFQAFASE
jgi:fluoride ion exporter CrcB/FEX